MRRGKDLIKNLVLLSAGIVLALILCEAVLRVYNPFEFRVRGDKIVLPAGKTYEFVNPGIPGLDDKIVHTKNSLGFSGPEISDKKPADVGIVTVGGSTTECFYLSDGKTWPDRLGRMLERETGKVWLNNAGLDGNSTFGHYVLINDYLTKLHPDFVLFLVGVNDVGRKGLSSYDTANIKQGLYWGDFKGFIRSAAKYSEVVNLALNISRVCRARVQGVGHVCSHGSLKNSSHISPEEISEAVAYHRTEFVPGYKQRIKGLIALCRENGIFPVFITQPSLLGEKVLMYGEEISLKDTTAEKAWRILQVYNDATAEVCEDEGVPVIRLGREMPKSTEFFYDSYHFTNAGAEKVASIVNKGFLPVLNAYLAGRIDD